MSTKPQLRNASKLSYVSINRPFTLSVCELMW